MDRHSKRSADDWRDIYHATLEQGIEQEKRAEQAEALADDLENQCNELKAGLEQAEARVAELEAMLGGLCAYPLCECGDGSECKVLDAPVPAVCARSDLVELEADNAALRDNYRATVEAALAILPGQREPHPDDSLQQLVNLARGLMEDNMKMDLSSDHPGGKLLAVVGAAREYCDRPTKRNRWALTESVDALDAKGGG